jgi:hypothetical protein
MSTGSQVGTLTFMSNPWMRIIRTAWVILAVLAVGIFIASIPGYMLRLPEGAHGGALIADHSNLNIGLNIASVVASMSAVLLSLALAWVLFRHKSNEPMAAFLSFYLLLFGVGFAGPLEALAGLLPEISPPVFQAVEGVIIGPMSIALFMLFPDGRFVPSGMRWMVLASIPIIPAGILIGEVYSTASPGLLIGVMVFWGLLLASALYAQIYRYRVVSSMTERQQTKWVVYGLTLWVLFMLISSVPYIQMQRLPPGSPLPWWVPVSELIWFSSNIFLPVSLTIAVLRYRLYDIDIIINRTLVYSVLTLSTMGLYVFIVGYLGNLFQAQNSSILAFLSTGLVAVIFQPLRDRLQGAVNRLMYGERDNPISVLTKLGKQLEGTASPQAALSQIVESIAQTLMLPHAAIEFGTGSKPQIIASFGRSTEETIRFPIIYQADNIGNLVVAPRSPGEPFSEIDITLASVWSLPERRRDAGSAETSTTVSDLNSPVKRSCWMH